MIAWCGVPGCNVLIVGPVRTNRCGEHKGQQVSAETDAQRIARVCAAMGWRRVVVR